MDHFMLQPDQYVRDLDIVKHWLRTNALNLVKRDGAEWEYALEWCRGLISKTGKHPIKNPTVTVITKDKHGDRYVRKTTYLAYLSNIAKKDLICSPSMTTYLKPKVRQSMLGVYINQNMGLRNGAKAVQKQAELEGNEELAKIKFNEQTSHKIFNNAISGAQSIGSTPMVLVSAHSSLTSGCRTATAYGTATIEKFVMGSRHYYSAEVVRTNIYSIISNFDREMMQKMIDRYELKVPTLMDLQNIITWCTLYYWEDQEEFEDIVAILATLDDLERAAFAYIGDFYRLRLLNPKFSMELLDKLGDVSTAVHPDPASVIKKMDGDHMILAFILCGDVTTGKSRADILRDNDPATMNMLASTYDHIISTLDEYREFIKCFWVTTNLPGNVSKGRDIQRRSVVGSDTDSCLFTVRDWVKWRHGEVKFDWKSQAIWHTMVFLTCQIISHNLALYSAGMGVDYENIHKLAMKNEMAFSVFGLTNIAKHYFASTLAKEGGVYKKAKLEIKGVQFKDSNSPPSLIQQNERFLVDIMDQIYRTGQCEVLPIFKQMADSERMVKKSIEEANPLYLKSVWVKSPEQYKDPSVSPYAHHEVWKAAFHKYGVPTEFPYRGARLSVDLNNKTAIKEWVESIVDPEVRSALQRLFVDTGKSTISSIIMPMDIIKTKGIPEEILQAASVRFQIYRACRPFYLTGESLGVPLANKRLTQMWHDNF